MNDETAEGPITEIPNKLQIQRALRRVTQRQTIIRVGANCEDWPRLPPQPPSNNSNIGCSLTIAGPLLLSHFCPPSTFSPTSVLFLSLFCPISVLCPTFVLFVSSNSQFCPVFDLVLSSSVSILSHFGPHLTPESTKKGEDKYWTKLRLRYFYIFYLVTLQLDKNGTKVRH